MCSFGFFFTQFQWALRCNRLFFPISQTARVPFCRRQLTCGDQVRLVRRITAEDTRTFAMITGDTNPIHLDPSYAQKTPFRRCIVHGVSILGIISCLFGVHFPGPGCAVQQINSRFIGPLFVGETCQLEAEVKEIQGRRVIFSVLATSVERQKHVLEAELKLVVTKEQLSFAPPSGVIGQDHVN
ncbi:3-hydroxybutyryl-CoA dehydratase [Paragonimus heterotremus]|uniref:3-hydroxybutyryl-CoA dehydratase n=1 Tax=Paragonimus heterotremus TaxID=100268 RepID=A0A8J4WL99_9TREM|nr:3-hydroxybutyryl-CoA dehydratase [Paragonimus heterotremus]